MTSRLTLALEAGLTLPADGPVAVLHPRGPADLSVLPRDRTTIIQPLRPDHDAFAGRGFATRPDLDPGARPAMTLVCLPRAKALARGLVAAAAATTRGPVVVDGAKTDGVDSLLREIRKRVPVFGPVAKAHGKIFWFDADPDIAPGIAPNAGPDTGSAFVDWTLPDHQQADGFVTAPGVFSADGIDPASALLAGHLPARLGGDVADLGAGWGYLSARALARDPGIGTLHLVEADHSALTCARRNVTDPRARFHWADALQWTAPRPLDTVLMNPPFHSSRSADPALGQGFIDAAARNLSPRGQLLLVANRHLPYEQALAARFAQSAEIAGDARFKILHATRPSRPRR